MKIPRGLTGLILIAICILAEAQSPITENQISSPFGNTIKDTLIAFEAAKSIPVGKNLGVGVDVPGTFKNLKTLGPFKVVAENNRTANRLLDEKAVRNAVIKTMQDNGIAVDPGETHTDKNESFIWLRISASEPVGLMQISAITVSLEVRVPAIVHFANKSTAFMPMISIYRDSWGGFADPANLLKLGTSKADEQIDKLVQNLK